MLSKAVSRTMAPVLHSQTLLKHLIKAPLTNYCFRLPTCNPQQLLGLQEEQFNSCSLFTNLCKPLRHT